MSTERDNATRARKGALFVHGDTAPEPANDRGLGPVPALVFAPLFLFALTMGGACGGSDEAASGSGGATDSGVVGDSSGSAGTGHAGEGGGGSSGAGGSATNAGAGGTAGAAGTSLDAGAGGTTEDGAAGGGGVQPDASEDSADAADSDGEEDSDAPPQSDAGGGDGTDAGLEDASEEVGDVDSSVDSPADVSMDGPGGCSSTAECPADQFCSKPGCTTTLGTCEPRPTTCGSSEQVVCGCDGVSYWNDCLRQRDGAEAVKTVGPCAVPLSCSFMFPSCPGSAKCVLEAMGCDWIQPSTPGACLVLPDTCPAQQAAEYSACFDTTVACVSRCEAMVLSDVIFMDWDCPGDGGP